MYYLKYNNQELPCYIDFHVVAIVCGRLDITLPEFDVTINKPDQLEVVVFEALKRGHSLTGKQFNYTENIIKDILSEGSNFAIFVQKIFLECVLKMTVVPKTDEQEQPDEDKKNRSKL